MERRVTLPSGAVVKVKRGSLLDFAFSGAIPAPLLSYVMRVEVTGKRTTLDETRDLIQAQDLIVSFFVSDPTVVAPVFNEDGSVIKPALKPGELGAWEMIERDKEWLFQTALAEAGLGAEASSKFPSLPQSQDGSVEPAPVGEGVRTEAQ
jgi:hypothetical protein